MKMNLSGRIENEESQYWLPQYADDKGCNEYQLEWRSYLNEKNEKDVEKLLKMPLNTQRFSHYSKHIVNTFHAISEELKLPPETLYIAIEIYDRFWLYYLGKAKKNSQEVWDALELDPLSQGLMRLFSSLQLAAKHTAMSKILSIKSVIKCMHQLGLDIDRKTVIRSEVEVYKTINMNIPHITVLTYVEMFLENIQPLLIGVHIRELLEVCIKVVNVCYKYHKDIYAKLHISFQKDILQTIPGKMEFLIIEGDNIRLSASVIYTSYCLYDPTRKLEDKILNFLCSSTEYTNDEIVAFSNIIFHVILRHSI